MGLTARLRRASLWRLLAMLLLPLLALVTGVELWMTRHDALPQIGDPAQIATPAHHEFKL